MRIAIVGSGGLGSLFGGLLSRAGEAVTLIARGENLEALRARGLTVRLLPAGEFSVAPPATADPGAVGPVDLVWCCVKSYDLGPTARQIVPLVGPDTVVLPIQNIADAAERLAAVLGPSAVIGGLCRGGATLAAPGLVVQKTTRVEVELGELDRTPSARTERVVATLRRAGIDARRSGDIRRAVWNKFLGVCGIHGVLALAHLSLGDALRRAETRALMVAIMHETAVIGRALGVDLPDADVDTVLGIYQARGEANPDVRPALWLDLVAGRRLEVEDTNGAVVRLGQRLGIPTPLNAAIWALLGPHAAGGVFPDGTSAAREA